MIIIIHITIILLQINYITLITMIVPEMNICLTYERTTKEFQHTQKYIELLNINKKQEKKR